MHDSYFYALMGMIGVFLVAGGLVAAALSNTVYRGLKRSWPLIVCALVYAALFVVTPPVPFQKVITRDGLTLLDATRYFALGLGALYWSRDYFRALCELDRHKDMLQMFQQGRGEDAVA